jgi:hypothetical protein
MPAETHKREIENTHVRKNSQPTKTAKLLVKRLSNFSDSALSVPLRLKITIL